MAYRQSMTCTAVCEDIGHVSVCVPHVFALVARWVGASRLSRIIMRSVALQSMMGSLLSDTDLHL